MKSRLVYQHDQNDCGAACLSTVASFYGLRIPIAQWREFTNTDKEGVSIYGMVEAAEKYGFLAEAKSGSVKELLEEVEAGNITVPLIANIVNTQQQSHFVVIRKIVHGRVYLFDPDLGSRKILLEEFSRIWLGYIVTIVPGQGFIRGDYTKGTIRRFHLLLKGQYCKLVVAFFASLIIAGLGIFTAFVFRIIVDQIGSTAGYYQLANEEEEECADVACEEKLYRESSESNQISKYYDGGISGFNVFFIGAIILYFVQYLIQYFRSWLMVSVSSKIDIDISMQYYGHVINLPMKSLEYRRTGEYLSRFSDAGLLKEAISSISVTVMLDSTLTIGCGIILFLQNSSMFFAAMGVVAVYLIILAIFRRPIEKTNRACMDKSADVESYLKEVFDGAETIKTNTLEKSVLSKGVREYSKLTRLAKRAEMISVAQDCTVEFIEVLSGIVIVWIGLCFVLTEKMTFGTLLAFYLMLGYFTSPIKSLFLLQPTIQTALVAADRLNDILDMEIEVNSTEKCFPKCWRRIDYNNVTFQYGEKNKVLNGINLHIHRGQHIAIVGKSGSGKSTLAKILIRLYRADAGIINIDGCNLETISLNEIRTHISYLGQNPFLFADTVRNNLSAGKDISDEQLAEVCKKCCIEDYVQSLPYGYDTLLSEMAKNISSGQKQRLAIARALLSKPSVLVLDEATSNIDVITEKAIKEELFKDKDLTVIMITHRLQSIVEFDNIVVIDKGSIVETGKHEYLIDKNGFYKKMWDNQNDGLFSI